jgi:hypothetical protein
VTPDDLRRLYDRWLLAPPGTEVSFGGIDIMRIEGGLIAEYWARTPSRLGRLGALG